MASRPISFKKISPDDTVFFAFESGNDYSLYDSGMGNPVKYGSELIIKNELENQKLEATKKKRKKFKVFWMMRDGIKGWKEKTQPPFGYSRNGIMEGMELADKNKKNDKIVPKLKKVTSDDQYYWFSMGSMHYVYDSYMGDPILYGNRGRVTGMFSAMNNEVEEKRQPKYIIWYFERGNDNDIWEHKQAPKIPKWKIEAADKREKTEEKKKEKEEGKNK